MQNRHSNRKGQQDRSGRGKVKGVQDKRNEKVLQGNLAIISEAAAKREDYDLSWFHPTEKQKEIIQSMCQNDLTAISGSSGVGKTTTAIWQALNDLKRGYYKHIVFIKTPSQTGDDDLGALKGELATKLEQHWDSMKSIFLQFMSKSKLESEERAQRIQFMVPNFIAGRTLDESLIVIDESQFLSPNTMKMVLERCGESSSVVLLGDPRQRYSTKSRQDGFSDFISKIVHEVDGEVVSKEPTMGYIRLTAKDSMRSDLSKRIVELYEG